jgi:hypothetical protein
MKLANCSQTKMFSAPVEKKETLYYLLTEPLVVVSGVDKDTPRMESESFEDYIKRRGLPPINGKLFDKNDKWSVSDQRYQLSCINHKSKEGQFEYLAQRWDEYDRMISRMKMILSVNKRDKDGYTPLHRAVFKRDLALVKELLQVPGIDVNMYNSNAHYGSYASKYMVQVTALGIAINNEYTEIVNELLNAPGIDTTKLDYID